MEKKKDKGKKVVIVGCGAQGLNQGLNMRDSGLDVSYALRQSAIDEKRALAEKLAQYRAHVKVRILLLRNLLRNTARPAPSYLLLINTNTNKNTNHKNTTPNTTTTHSYSSPVSGAPNAVALPQQQQSSSSPISEADVLVVDGETVTPTATTRTTDVALHTAEKIEAIHDISIVCDRCGKDNFRAAGELERHKTTQCIIAKTSEVIISDSLIETAVTTTTTSENENEAKQGERDGENVGKIIVANAIANIISEEGEANEKLQQDDTREIREEAFVERSREQNLSREEVKNEESIDEEEERGKEETTVFVDVNTAADVPRKGGCQSSSHKSEKRRELPLAEILHIAKDGFPFTKHASSGNISPPSVVISDSVHENTINTIEPANLEQEERRRKAPVSPLDENKEDKKKRLSGPSMKESDERVREMKEWRTENVHALHHGY